MSWILKFLTWSAICAAIIGIFLRFTVKDSVQPLAPAFYALPLPVCAAGFAGAAFLAGCTRRSLVFWGTLAGAILTGFGWLGASWSEGEFPDDDADLRVAFWNGADNRRVFTRAAAMLETHPADVIALAEVVGESKPDQAKFLRENPDFQVLRVSGEMALAVRGRAELRYSERLPNRTFVHVFQVWVEDRRLRLVLADVGPKPLHPRGAILARILKIAGTEPETIVVGDFNTPFESVWFEDYRRRFVHAFEAEGVGVRETWPWPLPALSLDHIWLAPGISVAHAEKRTSWASDHAMVVADIEVRPR